MKTLLSVASIGVLLALPYGARAQQLSHSPDPADPAAAVPPVVYESAIAPKPPASAEPVSPDKTWRAANAAVSAAEGHAAHGAATMSSPTPADAGHSPAPAPGAAPAQPAAPPDAGHGKHH